MGRQAQHHYIPASYLSGFTNGGEKTSHFIVKPKSSSLSFVKNPIGICKSRDYYTIEGADDGLIVEKFYAYEIEPLINKALKFILEKQKMPTEKNRDNLYLLLATLYIRHPKARRCLSTAYTDIARFVNEDIIEGVKVTNIDAFSYGKNDVITSELELLQNLMSHFSNKYYRLYVSRSSDHFITSDSPCYLSHPDMAKCSYFGINTERTEFCVPINKFIALVGSNEPMTEGVFDANEKFVALLNTKIANSSDKVFISSNREVKFVDPSFNVYKHTLETKGSNLNI